MSIRVTYDAQGFRELEQALKDLRKEMGGTEGNLTRKALMKAAYPVWREAQARAPVSEAGAYTSVRITKAGVKKMGVKKDQPGTLRKSIKRLVHRNPSKWSELVGIGVFLPSQTTRENPLGAWYAHFVEFGTVKMKAQPFLRPALESNAEKVVNDFGRELGASIEKAAAKIGQKYSGKIANTSANRRKFKGRA